MRKGQTDEAALIIVPASYWIYQDDAPSRPHLGNPVNPVPFPAVGRKVAVAAMIKGLSVTIEAAP